MASDPSLDLLLKAARHDETNGSEWQRDSIHKNFLPELIQHELLEIHSSMPDWDITSCLLHDLGNFLARTSTILSKLALNIVDGEEVRRYAENRIKEMEDDDDLSEFGRLFYMQEKHTQLKSFAEELQKTVGKLNKAWRTSPQPPFPPNQRRKDQSAPDLTETYIHMNNSLPLTISDIHSTPSTQRSSASEIQNRSLSTALILRPGGIHEPIEPTSFKSLNQQERDVSETVQHLLMTLSVRGTGRHCCPYKWKCTKGGVKDGEFVIFERNSAFRAHLQKHEKQFKCNLPGCNAKGGFARIDQLKRHQATVPHNKH